ncbi:MAG: SLAP domain-containing protein [Lactobacillus sp.]|nr:SLAP domain-containing protein [Lactobacillus sp.]MCI1481431.1 SLAP domain-containing protein [Lactobacillus sp.]
MSNKNRMMDGKMNRNQFRFSIRKLSIGVASILLGLGITGAVNQQTHAATYLNGTVHVKRVTSHPTWKILLWDGEGHNTGIFIKPDTNWKVFEKKNINGLEYYRLGTNRQWVQAQYTNNYSAQELEIFIVGDQPVYLVDADGADTQVVLPAKSQWKVLEKKTVKGNVYYRLGTQKQWVLAKESHQANNDYQLPATTTDTPAEKPVTLTDAQKDAFSTKNPIIKDEKVEVSDPAHLTKDQLDQVLKKIEAAHAGKRVSGLTQSENGDLTVVYKDGSKQNISLETAKEDVLSIKLTQAEQDASKEFKKVMVLDPHQPNMTFSPEGWQQHSQDKETEIAEQVVTKNPDRNIKTVAFNHDDPNYSNQTSTATVTYEDGSNRSVPVKDLLVMDNAHWADSYKNKIAKFVDATTNTPTIHLKS